MFFSEILFEQVIPNPTSSQPPKILPKDQQQVLQKPSKSAEFSKPKVEKNEAAPQEFYNAQQGGYAEDDFGDEGTEDVGGVSQELAFPPDLSPIRRYSLIEKLRELNVVLMQYNIKNVQLDTILTFINDLSYESLVIICNELIPSIEEQIVRLSDGKAQGNNTKKV